MFRRFTPGRFIPENAKAIEHSGGVVYTYSANSALYAVAYRGNRSKADWHYSFRTEERRNEEIQSFVKSLEASDQSKAELKMHRSQPHTIKAGEIVYNSWGYEQTNVDFYEVVKATAHFIWVQQIAAETTETGFMQGQKSALAGTGSGEITKHQVSAFSGGQRIHFEHGSGSLWDGQPKFCSWYA